MPKLEARVRQDLKSGPLNAFSGHEYVRYEWRPVPDGFEDQAKVNKFLEVREVKAIKAPPVVVMPEKAHEEEMQDKGVSELDTKPASKPLAPSPKKYPKKGQSK
jgi:hypothetical protein